MGGQFVFLLFDEGAICKNDGMGLTPLALFYYAGGDVVGVIVKSRACLFVSFLFSCSSFPSVYVFALYSCFCLLYFISVCIPSCFAVFPLDHPLLRPAVTSNYNAILSLYLHSISVHHIMKLNYKANFPLHVSNFALIKV